MVPLALAERAPLVTNDAVVFGVLMVVLALIFAASSSAHPVLRAIFRFVPALLLCYFVPGLLGTLGVYDPEASRLYFVASRYLLPASLVLLTLSLDLGAIRRLGWRMIVMFLAGTLGVALGGPLAFLIFDWLAPDIVAGVGPDAPWRGMTTVAGSWIGGGANQAAMKEVFEVGDGVFATWVTVDVIVANVWLAILLYGTSVAARIDRYTGADTTAIEALREKVERYQSEHARIPSAADLFAILGVGFGATAVGHLAADAIAPWIEANHPGLARLSLSSAFFWLVVVATTVGVALSFTPLKRLEGAGASRIGSVLLYVLVATIGMQMDLRAMFANPGLFLVGFVWIAFHAAFLIVTARLIRAPFFFVAVGSQANIGGAASAPVVASAFHPVLAPVGVLMAVLGYAVGTYGAWLCGIVLRSMAT